MDRDDWTEKLIVLRLAMTTTGTEPDQVINSVQEFLDMSLNNLRGALSTKVVHAAQTVCYKAPCVSTRPLTGYHSRFFGNAPNLLFKKGNMMLHSAGIK
jgi:hypothetical protein